MHTRHHRPVVLTVLFLLVAIPVLHTLVPVGHLFNGSLTDHKRWFPNGYPFSFVFFWAIYPALFGVSVYALLGAVFPTQKKKIFLLVVLQGMGLVYLLHVAGFAMVAVYLLPLPVAVLSVVLFPRLFFAIKTGLATARPWQKISGVGLFAAYIVLSLSIKGHPFSEYTMFNRFPDHTTAFLLRDNGQRLLPLREYSGYTGNELFEQYVALNQKHRFSHHPADTLAAEQNIVYRELLRQMLASPKKKCLPDSLRLMRVDFSFNGSQTQVYERQVMAYPIR